MLNNLEYRISMLMLSLEQSCSDLHTIYLRDQCCSIEDLPYHLILPPYSTAMKANLTVSSIILSSHAIIFSAYLAHWLQAGLKPQTTLPSYCILQRQNYPPSSFKITPVPCISPQTPIPPLKSLPGDPWSYCYTQFRNLHYNIPNPPTTPSRPTKAIIW